MADVPAAQLEVEKVRHEGSLGSGGRNRRGHEESQHALGCPWHACWLVLLLRPSGREKAPSSFF